MYQNKLLNTHYLLLKYCNKTKSTQYEIFVYYVRLRRALTCKNAIRRVPGFCPHCVIRDAYTIGTTYRGLRSV